nr:hypothetical protein [Tanacetum cinerariifolium]
MSLILSTAEKGYMYKYGGQHNATKDDNQSVGRPVAASRGGGMGGRAGRGGVRARGYFGDQDSSEIGNQGSDVC